MKFTIAIISVTGVLLAVACSQNKPKEPDAEEVETYSYERANVKTYCDLPGREPGYLHSSLKGLEAFIERLHAQPQKITPAQCIAVAAYAKTFDWFGETCAERDINSAAQWIRECAEGDWNPNSRIRQWDCQLLGYRDDEIYPSVQLLRDLLENNFAECLWDEKTRTQLITPNTIEAAVRALHGT